eukprot:gene39174-47665_t
MLSSIHDFLWTSKEDRSTLVLVDESFAEWIKWRGLVFEVHAHVRDISFVPAESSPILTQRLIAFVSDLTEQTLLSIKSNLRASEASECRILTTVSEAELTALYNLADVGESEDAYSHVTHTLRPVQTTVHYVPAHSISLIGPSSSDDPLDLDLRVLTKHNLRGVSSLTMQSLLAYPEFAAQQAAAAAAAKAAKGQGARSVGEVTLPELPLPVRRSLKVLAFALAGALVDELRLAPGPVYSFGDSTARLVADTVRQLCEDRASATRKAEVSSAWGAIGDVSSPGGTGRTPCALVLVDRVEDLFTPLRSWGAQSAAHRVLNTCGATAPSCLLDCALRGSDCLEGVRGFALPVDLSMCVAAPAGGHGKDARAAQ